MARGLFLPAVSQVSPTADYCDPVRGKDRGLSAACRPQTRPMVLGLRAPARRVPPLPARHTSTRGSGGRASGTRRPKRDRVTPEAGLRRRRESGAAAPSASPVSVPLWPAGKGLDLPLPSAPERPQRHAPKGHGRRRGDQVPRRGRAPKGHAAGPRPGCRTSAQTWHLGRQEKPPPGAARTEGRTPGATRGLCSLRARGLVPGPWSSP